MTERQEAALEAQKALAGMLLAFRGGALWEDDEQTLTEAMRIAQRYADGPRG